jgi:hypothetical protein
MSIDLSHFKTTTATIDALTVDSRLSVDHTVTVRYEHGHFSAKTVGIAGPIGASTTLDADQRRTLLIQLERDVKHVPDGVDTTALKAFVHVLRDAVIPG